MSSKTKPYYLGPVLGPPNCWKLPYLQTLKPRPKDYARGEKILVGNTLRSRQEVLQNLGSESSRGTETPEGKYGDFSGLEGIATNIVYLADI